MVMSRREPREMMIKGLASLIDGETPRAIEANLNAFLSPKARAAESAV